MKFNGTYISFINIEFSLYRCSTTSTQMHNKFLTLCTFFTFIFSLHKTRYVHPPPLSRHAVFGGKSLVSLVFHTRFSTLAFPATRLVQMQPKNSCTALRCRVCVADTKLSHARNVECGSFCRELSQQLRPWAAATKTTAGILSLFTNSCGEPSALVGSRLWRRGSRDSFLAECDSSSSTSTCLPPCSLARVIQPTSQPASTSVWQGRLSVGAVSEGSELSSSLPIAAYQKC